MVGSTWEWTIYQEEVWLLTSKINFRRKKNFQIKKLRN